MGVGAGLAEVGDEFWEGVAGVVFSDEDGVGGDERFGSRGGQVGEDAVVFDFVGVGRIDKNEVEGEWDGFRGD